MAHIEERKQKSGKVSFRAEIVVRIDGKKKKKSRTFSTRSVASNFEVVLLIRTVLRLG